jgi:diguanylate cyclase (GGDEF)-like protein
MKKHVDPVSQSDERDRDKFAQAQLALGQHDYQMTHTLALEVRNAALARGAHELAADAAILLAKNEWNHRIVGAARQWAEQARDEAHARARPEQEAIALVILASIHADANEGHAAVDTVTRALQLFSPSFSTLGQITMFTGVGLSYIALGLVRQAVHVFRRAWSSAAQFEMPLPQRSRYRTNLLEALYFYHDILHPVDSRAAQAVLNEASNHVNQLMIDAREINTIFAIETAQRFGVYLSVRTGDYAAARKMMDRLLQDGKTLDENVRFQLLVHRSEVAAAVGNHEEAKHFALQAQQRFYEGWGAKAQATALSDEMRMARALGQLDRALELQRHYYCWLIQNEYIAFDARLEELTAAVTAQAMQLQIFELEQRNARLSKTFGDLRDQARTDPLTGVLNRRGAEQVFSSLQMEQQAFALAMIDLDHFKRVNDEHSHIVGDQVLRQAAALLSGALRDQDFFARYGGEEFIALIRTNGAEEATAIAERLRKCVAEFDWSAVLPGLKLSVSVGVALVHPGDSFESAVVRSDTLLYNAKNDGRNRVISEQTSARGD